MPDQPAIQDPNRFPALIAHSGTEDAADTVRVVADSAGALSVNIAGTEPIELVAGTVTRVSNIGTLEVGSIIETRPATSAVTSVVGTNVNITLLASNTARRGAYFYNEGTSAANVKLGTTASTSSFTVRMVGTSFYECPTPVYSGIVDGIWDASAGTMHVTEIT